MSYAVWTISTVMLKGLNKDRLAEIGSKISGVELNMIIFNLQ
jgi:hypothetical protein